VALGNAADNGKAQAVVSGLPVPALIQSDKGHKDVFPVFLGNAAPVILLGEEKVVP